jgi:hypothetical protein
MIRRRYAVVFAVLAASTLFFGGMLTYKLAADRTAVASASAVRSASGQREGLTIEGRAVIQVIRDGRVITTWKGHNALYPYGKNAIAGCLSGATTAPAFYGSCSGFITYIYLNVSSGGCSGWCERASATNAVTPAGCEPTNVFALCTGWTTSATVTISQNETVTGAAATNAFTNWFDQIALNLAVNTGDRVAVTISFTVS